MPPRPTPRFARYRKRPGTPGRGTPIPSIEIPRSQIRRAVSALEAAKRRVELARIQTIAIRALRDTNNIITPIKTGRLRRSQRIRVFPGGGVHSRWLVHYAPVVWARPGLSRRFAEYARALLHTRLQRDTTTRGATR